MLTIRISTSNAAFDIEPAAELERILGGIADRIACGEREGSVRDINGNRVGSFAWDASEDEEG